MRRFDLNKYLWRQLVLGRRTLLHLGHIIHDDNFFKAICDVRISLLTSLCRQGWLKFIVHQRPAGGETISSVFAKLGRTVPSFAELVSREDWHTEKAPALDRWYSKLSDEDPDRFVCFPKKDLNAAFAFKINSEMSALNSDCLSFVPVKAQRWLKDRFYLAQERGDLAVRSAWQKCVLETSERFPEHSDVIQRQGMSLGNEIYHANISKFVAVENNLDLILETRLSSVSDPFFSLPEYIHEGPPPSVPIARIPMLKDHHVSHQADALLDPYSRLNDVRIEYTAALELIQRNQISSEEYLKIYKSYRSMLQSAFSVGRSDVIPAAIGVGVGYAISQTGVTGSLVTAGIAVGVGFLPAAISMARADQPIARKYQDLWPKFLNDRRQGFTLQEGRLNLNKAKSFYQSTPDFKLHR